MVTALYERRLQAEWELLQQLAARNPGRLLRLSRGSGTLRLCLHGPAAPVLAAGGGRCLIAEHDLRIEFPVHFPAVPMEMFLSQPVSHPNVHPETGFVCLWQGHRALHTVEHALHKLAAMLSGHLLNPDPLHVMQPDALGNTPGTAMPLLGVLHDAPVPPPATRRQRLQ